MRWYQKDRCARSHRFRPAFNLYTERLETRLAMSTANAIFSGAIAPTAVEAADAILSTPVPGADRSPASETSAAETAGSTSPIGYTPQQISAAYGINTISFGSQTGNGTGQTIAIVDAFDNPDLVNTSSGSFGSSDLARFDQTFGLPDPPSFEKLNQDGSASNLPGPDPAGASNPRGDWALEEALDVEWAHAMAPGANIILIEANSDNGSDMYQAAMTAAALPGVSVVSMSWGAPEYAGEQTFDSDFTTPAGHQGVTFVAATGDAGSPGEYPAFSPNVVAAGGTTLNLSSDGSIISETAWSDSGGGTSRYEGEPVFQQGAQSTGARTTPDVSLDANPQTGMAVFDAYSGSSSDPWHRVGGTSAATPCFASIVAIADQGRALAGAPTLDGASQTLAALYAAPDGFNDVTTGSNGATAAARGYDEVSGLGSPQADMLVPFLVQYDFAASVTVTTQPSAAVTAGGAFGVSVEIENRDGTLATSYNGNVTIVLGNNPGDATLQGTVTVNAHAGIAVFNNLVIDRAGPGYTIAIAAGGTAYVTSESFSVDPAAPAQLILLSEPGVLKAGAPFTLSAAIEDAFGNVITSYSGSIVATPAFGQFKLTRGGTSVVSVVDGVATFSNLMVKKSRQGAAIKLTTSDGLASITTTSLTASSRRAQPHADLRSAHVLSALRVTTSMKHGKKHTHILA